MKLLVVEDELPTIDFLRRGLTEEGFAIEVAADAASAEERIGIYEYDAILLDIMLPGGDGFALCRRWREEGLKTPILFLTAREEVTDVLNEMLTRLEAAFAAQARFVADASHEIRSPLSNLRGTVEVALRRPRSPDEYRQTLAAALVEIERLSRLTADLLTLSRADTGQFAMILSPGDLSHVAAEGVAAHRLRAEEQSIRLLLDEHGSLPIRGDADRLRQVLDNLLDNALRYAPVGSAVTVSALREGDAVCLRVTDEGPGLNEMDRERIFERFYRADTSRARLSGGLGLGLTISKAIAEAHGGRIEVQGRFGEGAAFTLCLPADEEKS